MALAGESLGAGALMGVVGLGAADWGCDGQRVVLGTQGNGGAPWDSGKVSEEEGVLGEGLVTRVQGSMGGSEGPGPQRADHRGHV